MKNVRNTVSLFVCLSATIAVADRQTFDETKTRVAMPFAEAPVIDGLIDTENEPWSYAGGAQAGGNSYWTIRFNADEEDFTRGGNVATGIGPLDESDFGADFYVGYDEENLYVAVRVIDDFLTDDSAAPGSENEQTWNDDSVEVFVDGDNSNFPERDTAGDKPEGWSTGGQYVVTINNAFRHAEAGNPGYGENNAWHGLSEINADGNMEFEFRISLDILGNPQPGDIIGFDIAVNDDDDGDTLENQYTWSGLTHVEASYGNLVLGPRDYTAPAVSSAPTIDGTINADEYGNADTISVTTHSGNYNGDDDWALGDHDWMGWIVHDSDAIYVAVDVTDDNVVTDSADAGTEDGQTWLDDSVEVFFDSDASDDNGRTNTNLFEGQFVLTANGAWRDNEANNPFFGETDEWFGAASTTSTGYQVEFKILKETLFEPADVMGFDIAVNDDDGTGINRKTQLAWNGRPHHERSYGNLTLSSEGGTSIAEWSLY